MDAALLAALNAAQNTLKEQEEVIATLRKEAEQQTTEAIQPLKQQIEEMRATIEIQKKEIEHTTMINKEQHLTNVSIIKRLNEAL